MSFGAVIKQNTYHIPLVLQYFLQATLGINFSAENKIFMEFQIFSWNLYFFRENSRNSWEFSIFAEIAISAPLLRAARRTDRQTLADLDGAGLRAGGVHGAPESRGAARPFPPFSFIFPHPLSSSVGVPRLLRRLLTPPHSNV